MQFDTLTDFFAMGGHGLYVWLAYGATVALLLLNHLSARREQRRILAELTWHKSVNEQRADHSRAGDPSAGQLQNATPVTHSESDNPSGDKEPV